MKKSLVLLLLSLLLVSLSTGCASKYGPQQTQVNYYPACYDPIQKLRNSEHDVAKGTAAGGAAGALIGAGLGFLASGGDAKAAIGGAVVGLGVGGVVGNQIASRRKIEDENARMAGYLSDLKGNISNLDIQTASAKAALQCYDRQFSILLAGIKSKKVSRAEAQRMFAEIQSGTQEATNILGVIEKDAREMEKQYRAALATEELELKQNPKKRTSKQIKQARTQLRQAQKSCDTLQASTQKVSSQKSAAERQLQAQQQELMSTFAEADA